MLQSPFSSSSFNACRPTIRSSAAILASCSWIRSAACTSLLKAPASNLPTQIRISYRDRSCRLANAYRVSLEMNSPATCRSKAMLCKQRLPSSRNLRRGISPFHPICRPARAHSIKGSLLLPGLHKSSDVKNWSLSIVPRQILGVGRGHSTEQYLLDAQTLQRRRLCYLQLFTNFARYTVCGVPWPRFQQAARHR